MDTGFALPKATTSQVSKCFSNETSSAAELPAVCQQIPMSSTVLSSCVSVTFPQAPVDGLDNGGLATQSRNDSPFESLRAHSDANAQVPLPVMVDMLVFMLPTSICMLLHCQRSGSANDMLDSTSSSATVLSSCVSVTLPQASVVGLEGNGLATQSRNDSLFESLRAHSDANAQVLPLMMVDMLASVLPISRCILLRCQQSNSELYILCLL